MTVISKTGTSDVIFLYNGEYGVVSDNNGLLYMRARYYSPELRRFVNADILMGDINNSPTLNRYAYANGNPISNIDPFGMAADNSRGGANTDWYGASAFKKISVTTINEEFDLTLDLGLIKVFHTQTVTTTKETYGKTGEWFGAYTDINVDNYGIKTLFIPFD